MDFEMVATTLKGLESVLADELLALGAQNIKKGIRAVSFWGDVGFLYKANLALRTAIRILKPIAAFKINSEQDLYRKIQKIHWEKYITPSDTFSVNALSNTSVLSSNTHYISLKTKDALADYFTKKYGKRPSVDLHYPTLKIHMHIQKDNTCKVSLDSSGESLHKRGYRSQTNAAPINEVLAAGLVLLSGYDGTTNFIEPMCGSGTILIEATMIACKIPANINRKFFAFENWKDYNETLFFKIHDALLSKIKKPSCKIMGFDLSMRAVKKANENIKNANLSEFVKVHPVNFFNSKKEVFGDTIIVCNPPYGERLPVKDLPNFYKKIGDTLKSGYKNTKAWILIYTTEALKNVGLRTSKRIALKNADLECRLVCYDIYEGSKK